MEEIKFLNIYKLNIYKVLTFMFKVKRDSAPLRQQFFEVISERYLIGIL